MKLEERLGANKYYVDETSPHILVYGVISMYQTGSRYI